jgi:hypothetical protein
MTIEPLPGNFPARMQSSGKKSCKKFRHKKFEKFSRSSGGRLSRYERFSPTINLDQSGRGHEKEPPRPVLRPEPELGRAGRVPDAS